MRFDERLPKARKDAKARAGSGWALLGSELQNALVCRELVAQLGGLDCWLQAHCALKTREHYHMAKKVLILSCPFCGNAELRLNKLTHSYQVECGQCGACGPTATETNSDGQGLAQAAIGKWNYLINARSYTYTTLGKL